MPSASSEYDFVTWSEFRYQIRRYIRTAEAAAREAGLEPQQHQLLLAVRGYPGPGKPTISDLAARLQIRHHSTVELLNRMEEHDLIQRRPTGVGRSVVVQLTPRGRRALDNVSRRLRPELDETAAQLIEALTRLLPARGATARAPEASSKAR